MFQDDREGFFDRCEFWRHSIAVGVLSRMVAARARHPRPDEAFTCGLLHDIGKLILDQYLHHEMTKVLRCAHQSRIPFVEAEKRTMVHVDHTTIGESAAKTWRLPIVAVVSIRHHHTPREQRKGLPLSDDVMVDIVRYADFLAHDLAIGESGGGAPPDWSPDLVSRLALDAEAIAAIREGCVPEIGETAAFLDLPIRQRA
jgi:putative nucleotidyltransferase with HDIG domain